MQLPEQADLWELRVAVERGPAKTVDADISSGAGGEDLYGIATTWTWTCEDHGTKRRRTDIMLISI